MIASKKFKSEGTKKDENTSDQTNVMATSIMEVETREPNETTPASNIPHQRSGYNIETKKQNFKLNRQNIKSNQNTGENPGSRKIRDPICIYVNKEFEKYLDSSPKLLKYVNDNTTVKPRSIMRDKKRVLLYPETISDAEELMNPETDLFPGCPRRNIGMEKLALVFINISQEDVDNFQEIRDLFFKLSISGSCPLIKDNYNSKIIKVFFHSFKEKLLTLQYYYKNGITLENENIKINIRVEPCIKPINQCNKCNKYQHREDSCREKLHHCSYCNKTDHPFNQCQETTMNCTNCGGNHNAYNHRECEKFKNIKKLEVRKEIENLLGLTSGSIAKNSGITYAEITQAHKMTIPVIATPASQNHIQTELNEDIIKKLEHALENSNNCVNTAKLTLDAARRILEKVDENMKTVARKECEFFFAETSKVIDQKVTDLRSEFSNWYYELQSQINQKNDNWNHRRPTTPNLTFQMPNPIQTQPQSLNQSNTTPNISYLVPNYIQTQAQNLNQNSLIQNQPMSHAAFLNSNPTSVPQGNSTYTVLQNVTK